MDIVIMVTLSQCIIFGSHIPQGAPSSDSMSDDLRNKRRNNPAEEFGEEEQEKNTFILIGMETPVRIECIIANQLLCMIFTTENGIQEDILLALSYYLSYLIDNTKLSV
ncbi:uncharacterized protein [Aegilops tauschii subsp. strangulata]|uniref:uncharacterized protein n=1 Tax=Aegilops tauschii subsp. strangulata TaxID=200361 RepID=UPI003CC85530